MKGFKINSFGTSGAFAPSTINNIIPGTGNGSGTASFGPEGVIQLSDGIGGLTGASGFILSDDYSINHGFTGYTGPGGVTGFTGPILWANSNIIPWEGDTYTLGTRDRPWKDAWFGQKSVHIGNGTISFSNDGSKIIFDGPV